MGENRFACDLPALLARLSSLKGYMDVELYHPIILEACGLIPDVPEADALSILQRALPPALETADPVVSLKQRLRHEKQQYLALPERELVLLTSISVEPTLVPRRATGFEAALRFSARPPRQFASAWVAQKTKQHSLPPQPTNYSACRVHVRARTSREAMDRGHFELDFFRGRLNFILGFRRNSFTLIGSPHKARGAVAAGPTYTIHEPSGALVAEELGVNTGYAAAPGTVDEAMTSALLKQRRVWSTIRRSKAPMELANAFVQLARALDSADSEACLLQLWALLEHLTGAGSHHDKVVARAAALFQSEEPKRSVLQHLRFHRNRMVHTSHASEFTHLLVNNLTAVVHELLAFHLSQGRRFDSIEAASQLLELPREVEKLQAKIRLLKTALRYRMRGAA